MAEKKVNYKIKKIGPYLLIKEIGKGAYSTVYKAKIENTHENVAIKMIPVRLDNQRTLQRV